MDMFNLLQQTEALKKMLNILQATFFNYIFWNEHICTFIQMSLKYQSQKSNFVMACCRQAMLTKIRDIIWRRWVTLS